MCKYCQTDLFYNFPFSFLKLDNWLHVIYLIFVFLRCCSDLIAIYLQSCFHVADTNGDDNRNHQELGQFLNRTNPHCADKVKHSSFQVWVFCFTFFHFSEFSEFFTQILNINGCFLISVINSCNSAFYNTNIVFSAISVIF